MATKHLLELGGLFLAVASLLSACGSRAVIADADRFASKREAMVRSQIESRGIDDPRVLAAMRKVPRHLFVPAAAAARAYADGPLAIGNRQTISQPYIVAFMTEAIGVGPSSKVLEVGTGSGYQAAVLAELTPHVFSIEIVEPLARTARERFDRLGYAGIRTRTGDGYFGWPEEAPFDAILVTAAPGFVPPELVEQLAPGGRLCIPVGDVAAGQDLLLIEKGADGHVERRTLAPVRFVPMTGEAERR